MAAHRLGAERVQLVVQPSGTGGVGGAPMRLPVGRVHAMDDSRRAACGQPGELLDFGAWRPGPFAYCRACEERVPFPADDET